MAAPDDTAPPAHAVTDPDFDGPVEHAPRPGPGVVIGGRYELERRIGGGGMGDVYKARHVLLGTPVALKVLHPYLADTDEFARRFQREARATSTLDHPNVVRILDFGSDRGLLYIVMEYLDGETVSAWLARRADPPPIAEAVDVTAQVLDALAAAHLAGIVHRDLKPDNVFTRLEASGRRTVKVVDFGFAHFDDDRDRGATLTQADVVAGTPKYMSPEQCHSLAVGPASDLYSVGCVLTELLQKKPPFEGESAIQIITQHLFLPPAPLARPAHAEPVPPLLEELRLALLAKSPESRPRGAEEAARRLRASITAEAAAKELPPRKDGEPLGAREARAPSWDATGPAEHAAASADVRLVRLAPRAEGVTADHVTGLAAQGLRLHDDATPRPVVLLDAGADVDGARAFLERERAADASLRVVVCLDGASAARLNALIAAGAADVVAYPITPDRLAKKLARVVRRGR
jgi:serine/threonine-protein kinase